MSGRPETKEGCIVPDCSQEVVRHLALAEARRAFENLPEKGRSAPLCREHYKQWKKATKKDRTLERLGR
ncbi:MAG: hypothetical protein ACHQ16_04050 [Candidatus Lutacidiplasmatales archaeon]